MGTLNDAANPGSAAPQGKGRIVTGKPGRLSPQICRPEYCRRKSVDPVRWSKPPLTGQKSIRKPTRPTWVTDLPCSESSYDYTRSRRRVADLPGLFLRRSESPF